MPGTHAILSPSKSARFLTCTPSARLEEKLNERFGERGSIFAAEGTLAHSVAELKLRKENGEINDFRYKTEREALGEISTKIDRATDIYADIVIEKLMTARHTCPDAKLFIETRLDMGDWVPHCFGTGDAVIVGDEILEVIDYKNGSGVPVSAINNSQTRLYGLGAIKEYGMLYGFKNVCVTIVQPNIDNISSESMTRQDLLDWGEAIKPNAQLAWEGKGEFQTGDHCRFCAARAICAARAAEAMKIFQTGLSPVGVIPDEEIPRILPVLDTAESWIKDIRAYALSQALAGQEWPGYILTHGKRPNRQWTDEEAVKEQLIRAGIEKEQYLKTTLRSPGDIEKLLGKSSFKALMGALVSQGEGKLELQPEDCGRIPVQSADVAFADLIEN